MIRIPTVVAVVATVCIAGAEAQTLKNGSRGNAVKAAQRALVLHGQRLSIDGVYGPKTAGAVKAFQRTRGLPQTGRVDSMTRRALQRPVKRGDQGNAVKQMQRQLNRNGANLSADGVFGPKTESALKSFQRSMGLSQSGDLNSSTLNKLLGSSRSSSSSGGTSTIAAGKGGAVRSTLIRRAKRYMASNPSGFKKNVLVIVDFTKRSSQKRLFIVDARSSRVLSSWKTAHGSGSDPSNTGRPVRFSNRSGSHMSSIGFYRTAETYNGKYGYSLRVDGLSGSNSRARGRAIVMHPSKYIREGGSSGRSWGCFSVDSRYSKKIIKQIKGGVLLYAYGGEN